MKHIQTSDQREFLWLKCDVPQPQLSKCTTIFQWNEVATTSHWDIIMTLDLENQCTEVEFLYIDTP